MSHAKIIGQQIPLPYSAFREIDFVQVREPQNTAIYFDIQVFRGTFANLIFNARGQNPLARFGRECGLVSKG